MSAHAPLVRISNYFLTAQLRTRGYFARLILGWPTNCSVIGWQLRQGCAVNEDQTGTSRRVWKTDKKILKAL